MTNSEKKNWKKFDENRKKWDAAHDKCQDLRKIEDAAFQKILPNIVKDFKAAKKAGNAGIWDDFLPDGFEQTVFWTITPCTRAYSWPLSSLRQSIIIQKNIIQIITSPMIIETAQLISASFNRTHAPLPNTHNGIPHNSFRHHQNCRSISLA